MAFPARIQDEVSLGSRRDDPFTAADLPGDLDDESRLVLVRRLVREGLLESARHSDVAAGPARDRRAAGEA